MHVERRNDRVIVSMSESEGDALLTLLNHLPPSAIFRAMTLPEVTGVRVDEVVGRACLAAQHLHSLLHEPHRKGSALPPPHVPIPAAATPRGV
jgi:hypothetical protein